MFTICHMQQRFQIDYGGIIKIYSTYMDFM